jgi:glutathione S-transferase
MTKTSPTLVTMGVSPFCERARWALDWHGLGYNEIGWPPGLHQILAQNRGLKTSTVPILMDGATIIQGSATIIDWAEKNAIDPNRSLTPQADRKEAEYIEQRTDAVIGVHVRRLTFAETLPSYPHLLRLALFQRASAWHRLFGNMMWPVSRRLMLRKFDIRAGAAAESRAILELELDWLDTKLSDGRPYLAGGRFSRADLTVASLLAFFAKPKEMLRYHAMIAREALTEDVRRWSERPVMRWVLRQYRAHRAPPQGSAGWVRDAATLQSLGPDRR